MDGACSKHEENVYKVSVVESEEKRPLGFPTRRREDNIKVVLKEIS
jgi:hypothetical protein